MEALSLQPTWLLETSPGNYQAGYILHPPLTDQALADRLMKAIVDKGLSDPGASGPTTRLARLPEAINGKHEPNFPCRLAKWSPDNKYTVDQLYDGLGLEQRHHYQPQRTPNDKASPFSHGYDAVWTPCPTGNPVVTALQARGLYKNLLGVGQHDITCPWVTEHTDAIDSGSAYFEPNGTHTSGGFNCLHGHCRTRNIHDLLGLLGINLGAAKMKATIHVQAGRIPQILDAAEQAIANEGGYYQRGGQIVALNTDLGTLAVQIQPLSQSSLTRVLAEIVHWERADKRSDMWVETDPPTRYINLLLDAQSYKYLPVINGLARQPFFRHDGNLVLKNGYDAETGIFGEFDPSKYSIAQSPTQEMARDALAKLKLLLEEFAFAAPSDMAAALSGILTASIRPSLKTAPMFHIRAHTPGSGKSYLCDLIASFATPQKKNPVSFPSNEEEFHKLLFAELLQAPPSITYDNLTTDILPYNTLCSAITSDFINGRILGASKTATVSTRTLLLSSGNNVGPLQDMARRCLTINLSPEHENPAAKSFKTPDLLNKVMQNRESLVSASLTIIYAWIVAGRPYTTCMNTGSFNDWSNMCRQPLLWLGCDDPATSMFQSIHDDPDRDLLRRLLTAWKQRFGSAPTRVRDAIHAALGANKQESELYEVLFEIAGDKDGLNPRRLGRWMKRFEGRIVESVRIARTPGNGSAERWRAEEVKSVTPVLTVSSPLPSCKVKSASTVSGPYLGDSAPCPSTTI